MNKLKNRGRRMIMFLFVESCIVRERFSTVWSCYAFYVTLSLVSYQNHVSGKLTG